MKLRFVIFTICILFSQLCIAQHKRYVLMLSKGEKKMWVLDYKTLELVTKIPVGEDPHEIELSSDHHTAYVSNAIIAGTGHIINVIDLRKLANLKDIDTEPFYVPHGMVYQNVAMAGTASMQKNLSSKLASNNLP